MAGEGGSDRIQLLDQTTSTATTPTRNRYDDPHLGYELHEVDVSDVGSHMESMMSQYPPPYSAGWEVDSERGGKAQAPYNM